MLLPLKRNRTGADKGLPDPLRVAVLTDRDLATLPGVMFGSSSILLLLPPCHGLPGTNSGISKLALSPAAFESVVEVVVIFGPLLELAD